MSIVRYKMISVIVGGLMFACPTFSLGADLQENTSSQVTSQPSVNPQNPPAPASAPLKKPAVKGPRGKKKPKMMPSEEFMTKLKNIHNELNKEVIEYNQEKDDFERSLQVKLNQLGNSESDQRAKLKIMDEAKIQLDQMAVNFKKRIDAFKRQEDGLRKARYGAHPRAGIRGKRNAKASRKIPVKDLQERIRKQDEELRKEKEATGKLNEAPKEAVTKPQPPVRPVPTPPKVMNLKKSY